MSNYDTALKAEAKRVVRCWQAYTSEQRSNCMASLSLGYQQRRAFGEYYYVHPDVPGKAFPRRKLAAEAAMRQSEAAF